MSGFVYFIKPVGQAGPIKVGHSAYPPERLGSLQTWSFVELEIISRFAGTRADEKAIHQRFADCQVRGEWFEAVEDLVSLAEGIRAGGKLEDLIDLTVKTGKLFRRSNTKRPEAKIIGIFKRRVDLARQKASAIRGKPMALPKDIAAILNDAGGYRQDYRFLTDDEISILEAFIADCRGPKPVEVAA